MFENIGKMILNEDTAGTAEKKTRALIDARLKNKIDLKDIAKDENGKEYLTLHGKKQTWMQYIEGKFRDEFIHAGINVKFEPGAFRIAYDELKWEQPGIKTAEMAELKDLLRYVSETEDVSKISYDVNGHTFESLKKAYEKGMEAYNEEANKALKNKKYKKSNYIVKHIKNFSESSKWSDYTNPNSKWCLTYGYDHWCNYVNGGNKAYFCYLPNFKEISYEPNTTTGPKNEYGYSLMCVIIAPSGKISTVTSRWNHEDSCGADIQNADNFITAEELSDLIGKPYYEVFKPYSPEELAKLPIMTEAKFLEILNKEKPKLRSLLSNMINSDEGEYSWNDDEVIQHLVKVCDEAGYMLVEDFYDFDEEDEKIETAFSCTSRLYREDSDFNINGINSYYELSFSTSTYGNSKDFFFDEDFNMIELPEGASMPLIKMYHDTIILEYNRDDVTNYDLFDLSTGDSYGVYKNVEWINTCIASKFIGEETIIGQNVDTGDWEVCGLNDKSVTIYKIDNIINEVLKYKSGNDWINGVYIHTDAIIIELKSSENHVTQAKVIVIGDYKANQASIVYKCAGKNAELADMHNHDKPIILIQEEPFNAKEFKCRVIDTIALEELAVIKYEPYRSYCALISNGYIKIGSNNIFQLFNLQGEKVFKAKMKEGERIYSAGDGILLKYYSTENTGYYGTEVLTMPDILNKNKTKYYMIHLANYLYRRDLYVVTYVEDEDLAIKCSRMTYDDTLFSLIKDKAKTIIFNLNTGEVIKKLDDIVYMNNNSNYTPKTVFTAIFKDGFKQLLEITDDNKLVVFNPRA